MTTEKKTRPKRAARKGFNYAPTATPTNWDSVEAESVYLRHLTGVQGAWGSYYASMPRELKAQRRRALAVLRIVKAALDAFVTGNNQVLTELEKHAKHALRIVQEKHYEDTESFMVDLTKYEPRGWSHSLGDVVREKGDPQGRPRAIEGALNTLAYSLGEGLDAGGFSEWMLMWLSSPFTDFTDLLPDLRVIENTHPNDPTLPSTHPQVIAMARARKAFESWERTAARDPETLLKAGFRAFGMTKDGAANLLKFRDKRATTGAEE